MIVYFSGTGNSRYAAELLAQRLEDEVLDAGACMKKGKPVEPHSEKPWVFVAPTYGWQMPHVFTEFIQKTTFFGTTKAYFVLTCGSDIGNAGKGIAALCRDKGFSYQGVLDVVMPENYVAMFAVPTKEEAAGIIDQARPVLEQAAERILQGLPFPWKKVNVLDALKSSVVNAVFYRFFVKADPFYATDACNGCGLCQKLCPCNNILVTLGRPNWGVNCTHCMACICRCPKEAIEYGKHSQGKPRYQCPDYQG